MTNDAAVAHETAAVNGARLHVARAGARGPHVLFLHGFPELWRLWRPQLADLGRDHQAVAIDLRGYGESSRPRAVSAYRMPVLVEDVRALAAHLGAERLAIVGLALLLARVALDLRAPRTIATADGGVAEVVAVAHLAGLVAALALGAAAWWCGRRAGVVDHTARPCAPPLRPPPRPCRRSTPRSSCAAWSCARSACRSSSRSASRPAW